MTGFLLLIVVLLAIWIWRSGKRTGRNESLIAQLSWRVFDLEQELKQLRAPPAELAPPPATAVARPAPAATPAPVRVPSPIPQYPQTVEPPPHPEPSTPLPEPPREAPASPPRKLLNLEETLGTNWLNKLGIVILVIGVALFLAYELTELGPLGKVIVGYAVSAVMLGAGIFFERRDQWRVLARTVIGGGWALLYFTTYAMYHVPAAHVLPSESVDLILLLVVAAAIVVHTLRYDSQVVSGLAFLLAFTTVNISRGDVYSLLAGFTLATGLVVVTVRRRWFEMEIAGMAAAYFNHYLWLRPVIEPMHGHVHVFPGYLASSVLLYSYWLIFRSSYVVRTVDTRRGEQVSTIAAVLNVAFLGWVMGYQSVHPELAFQFFLGIGAVEFVIGQLSITRRRRAAFIVLTTIGTCLLVAAISYRYSGNRLSVGWLAQGEALLLAGVFLKELVFRRLGLLVALAVWLQMLVNDAAPVLNERLSGGNQNERPGLALLFGFAALIFYLNSQYIPRRWPEVIRADLDHLCFEQLAHLGGALAFIGLWLAWPGMWTAVAWAAFGTLLAFFARRWRSSELSPQAPIYAGAAVLRVLWVNLHDNSTYFHLSWLTARLVTVSIVIVLLYVCPRWSNFTDILSPERISASYTWAAAIIAGFLVWYELEPVAVALGWSAIALILLEVGLEWRKPQLRLQAYAGLAVSFLRLFVVNLNVTGHMGEISARVYTTVPLVLAFYYVYGRISYAPGEFVAQERRWKIAGWNAWFGVLALAALLRFEIDTDWVAAGWAALALVLAVAAWKIGRRILLDQSLLLAFGVLLRGVFHNLYERSYFPAPFGHGRFVTLGGAIALLFLVIPFARALRQPRPETIHPNGLIALAQMMDRRPDQIFFFIPFVLLTSLLAIELPPGMVTLGWGVEAFAIFALALWLKERSYRLTALGLLLLCVLKIVFRDVWGLAPRDRYLTFIVLGLALLAVSYLYTRYREVLRQYL